MPCSQCEKVYIGETGRQLGTRITEHRKEAEKISDRSFTRSTRRASTNEHHKSAITDHVCQNNHIMNWEASEIIEQEIDKFKRWIKESIYSYFEKGCRKKCTRQSRKALWVVLSSLFFKEI